MDTSLNVAADQAGARYISIREALRGNELCTKKPWVKPITSAADRVVENQQQMAHPTEPGQEAIAKLVRSRLDVTAQPDVVPVGACTPAASVAAIIDDSGSMGDTDPQGLRRRAMELLITKPGGGGRTLGAVQFGDDASPLFAPASVASGQGAMLSALSAIRDDDGGTDYDAAFAASASQQPGAEARIFLTDGGHNDGAYLESHRGGPRTFVIGLDIEDSGTDDAERLARIAAETGGAYFALKKDPGDSAQTQALRLQPVFNSIDALLDCRAAPDIVTRQLDRAGQYASAVYGRFLRRAAVEVVVSWGTPDTDIDVTRVTPRSPSGVIVDDLRGPTKRFPKRRKLVTSTVEGATFDTVTVRRPPRASRITLKVARLRCLLPAR